MARAARRDAGARVAAKTDRRDRVMLSRAKTAITRVHALAELDELVAGVNYLPSAIPGPLGIGHRALLVQVADGNGSAQTLKLAWRPRALDAWELARQAALDAGGDHRARIARLRAYIAGDPE